MSCSSDDTELMSDDFSDLETEQSFGMVHDIAQATAVESVMVLGTDPLQLTIPPFQRARDDKPATQTQREGDQRVERGGGDQEGSGKANCSHNSPFAAHTATIRYR